MVTVLTSGSDSVLVHAKYVQTAYLVSTNVFVIKVKYFIPHYITGMTCHMILHNFCRIYVGSSGILMMKYFGLRM